ncbi:hypothetical protein GGI06_000761, partial [Coemansia sp. S85]
MLGGATPYATVSSRISQHFKRIFDHHPPRPPILGRVAHEKHVRKYFYYVASAEEQEDFNYKLDHSPGIRRSLSRRAVSVDVSEQPAVQVGRSRRTSYDDGCGLEVVESNPYARKRYRSVRSAVEQAYPRRRRADEGAGKWRRTDGLDGIFDGSLAVAPARDDLAAAAVVTDLLTPGLDDSVVPLCLGDSNLITGPIEQATDGLASPPVALHGHTTTPADSSPRLLSSAGSSAAAAAADYDFSFHDLMDAELMSVNELENLWATSNPADEQGDTHAAVSASVSAAVSARVLAPIPERADEDGEAAPSRATGEPAAVDSVEPTAALVDSASDHFAAGEAACGSKVVLPDPFGDIAASAMVATTVAVSPRVVLTIVETVPVYMTVVTTTEPAGGQGKWL